MYHLQNQLEVADYLQLFRHCNNIVMILSVELQYIVVVKTKQDNVLIMSEHLRLASCLIKEYMLGQNQDNVLIMSEYFRLASYLIIVYLLGQYQDNILIMS